MLGWLFPRPPVRVYEKAWIEYRFVWLIDFFGSQRMLDAPVILPTDDFFPEHYEGTQRDAHQMFRRVCGFLHVNPDDLQFEVLPEDRLPDAAGQYGATLDGQLPVVRVSDTQIQDPQSLVSTLAHNISRHILLDRGVISAGTLDHQLLTDLFPCVFGLGIFTANSTTRFKQYTEGGWHWYESSRQGYLPAHWIGYALAMFAWLRNERRPTWEQYLRPDARESLAKGVRFLERTSDCYLRPEDNGVITRPSLSEASKRMRQGTPSARIQAIWDTLNLGPESEQLNDIRDLIRHQAAGVRRAALEAVGLLHMADDETVREVIGRLRSRDVMERVEAINTIGTLQPDNQAVVVELGRALRSDVSEIAWAAVHALAAYGARAAPIEKDVLAALHRAMIDCNHPVIDVLLEILRHASHDAAQSINDYFYERDPEFRQAAIDALFSLDEDGA